MFEICHFCAIDLKTSKALPSLKPLVMMIFELKYVKFNISVKFKYFDFIRLL